MSFYPFTDGDSHTTFRNFREKVVAEIWSLENEYVLKSSESELEQYFIDRSTLDVPELDVANYYIDDQRKTSIDVTHDFRRVPGEHASVPGTVLTIAIPYSGDPSLLKLEPSTFSLSAYPEIEARDGLITFSVSFPDDSADAQQLKSQIDDQVQLLANAIGNLANDVRGHNEAVSREVAAALQHKRKQSQEALSVIAGLGIPMRRRDDTPSFSIPAKRRKAPSLPEVPKGRYEPEPTLAIEEYEHILSVLRSMSLVMERSPSAFDDLDEEAIRTHFLIQLNGHYEGDATGETFNAAGKTDILIRAGDRNVFIAECKFWRGAKAHSGAIDQLLSYLTWRDSKTALLVFNRNKDSASVREKMHEVISERPQHRKTISHDPNGDSRYVLVKTDEPGREILLTTLLFDMPRED